MAATLSIEVPHLGGIKAAYAICGGELDSSKPTCVLINALHTTVAFWRPQFESEKLAAAVNLLAIEPLGHGATTCPIEHFTYWDTAIMALQVMDKLGVEKAFAMGTSQGGFIVTRMALLAPERVSSSSNCLCTRLLMLSLRSKGLSRSQHRWTMSQNILASKALGTLLRSALHISSGGPA